MACRWTWDEPVGPKTFRDTLIETMLYYERLAHIRQTQELDAFLASVPIAVMKEWEDNCKKDTEKVEEPSEEQQMLNVLLSDVEEPEMWYQLEGETFWRRLLGTSPYPVPNPHTYEWEWVFPSMRLTDTTTPSFYDQVQAYAPPGGTPLQYRNKRP